MIADETDDGTDDLINNIAELESMLGLCEGVPEQKSEQVLKQIQQQLELISLENSAYTEKLLQEKLRNANEKIKQLTDGQCEEQRKQIDRLAELELHTKKQLHEKEKEYKSRLEKLQADNDLRKSIYAMQKEQYAQENQQLQLKLNDIETANEKNLARAELFKLETARLKQEIDQKDAEISTIKSHLEQRIDQLLLPRNETKKQLISAQIHAKDMIKELKRAKEELNNLNQFADKQVKRRLMRNVMTAGENLQLAVNECKELMQCLSSFKKK